MTSTSRRTIFCRGILLCVFCIIAFGWAVPGIAQEPSPAGLDSLYARALASANKDSMRRAVRALEQGAERASQPARTYIRIGRLYAKLRDSDRAVRAFRRAVPGISITTDIIVGFPSEREEDFQGTLELVREIAFDQAFSFQYSPRPGTRAAEFEDDVSPAEKSRTTRLTRHQDGVRSRQSARSSVSTSSG